VHYHFLTEQEFMQRVNDDLFLEWAIVHGKKRYGTLKKPIEDAIKSGRPALLEIDLQGARNVKQKYPDANFVFLAPPSFEELITRLGMRGTESQEERMRRLDTARVEMQAQSEFDYVVVNDNLELAIESLSKIVI
jgi:guanylate kinase